MMQAHNSYDFHGMRSTTNILKILCIFHIHTPRTTTNDKTYSNKIKKKRIKKNVSSEKKTFMFI